MKRISDTFRAETTDPGLKEFLKVSTLVDIIRCALHRAERAERKLGRARKRIRELTAPPRKAAPFLGFRAQAIPRVTEDLWNFLVDDHHGAASGYLATLHDEASEYLGDYDAPLVDLVGPDSKVLCVRIHTRKAVRDLAALRAQAMNEQTIGVTGRFPTSTPVKVGEVKP